MALLMLIARDDVGLHDWSSRDGNQLLLNMGAKLQKLRIFEYFCKRIKLFYVICSEDARD